MEFENDSVQQVQKLSEKTGLTPFTVAELLYAGWRYVEKLGEISRWEHPMWQMDRKGKIDDQT